MRISDWSSDVCSSDLGAWRVDRRAARWRALRLRRVAVRARPRGLLGVGGECPRVRGLPRAPAWRASRFGARVPVAGRVPAPARRLAPDAAPQLAVRAPLRGVPRVDRKSVV